MTQTMTRAESLGKKPKSKWFRGDINGLRALAIIPVVAFHAGLPGLDGGFIGVDIFYVISGFLITSILIREAETTGTVRLRDFWAKRLRRLVPALALVVLVSLPIAVAVSSVLTWEKLGTQAGAALLYVSNMLFAQDATDYFADDISQSPYLHTWSLGVEEQFYVVWPLIVILATVMARRRKIQMRTFLIWAFTATLVLSFAVSLYLTYTRPGWAFYMLPPRAWEFAAAGLLAAAPIKIRSAAVRNIMVFAGVATLIAGIVMLSGKEPFPGTAALVPVIGTLLVIAGGTTPRGLRNSFASQILAAAPIQWIGTMSYSWYLWHWPAIVLTAAVLQTESVAVKTVAAVASLGLAAVTYTFVENKLRFARSLTNSAKRTFTFAVVTTLAIAVLAGGTFAAGKVMTTRKPYAQLAAAQAAVPDTSCVRSSKTPSGQTLCEMGDLNGKTTVVFAGDSHAGHWKAAMSEAAKAEGIRLIMRWKSSCPAIDVQVVDTRNQRVPGCADFQRQSLEIIKEVKPSAVVTSQAAAYGGRILGAAGEQIPYTQQLERWSEAYSTYLDQLKAIGTSIALIEDNPRYRFDPLLCISRIGADAQGCKPKREDSLDQVEALNGIGRDTAKEHGITNVLTTAGTICDGDTCSITDADGTPIFRDYNHLSVQWTAKQVPLLERLLREATKGIQD